jgi:hypothetical protein
MVMLVASYLYREEGIRNGFYAALPDERFTLRIKQRFTMLPGCVSRLLSGTIGITPS